MYRRRLLIRPCYRAAICKKRNCTVIFTAARWNAGFFLAMFAESDKKSCIYNRSPAMVDRPLRWLLFAARWPTSRRELS